MLDQQTIWQEIVQVLFLMNILVFVEHYLIIKAYNSILKCR